MKNIFNVSKEEKNRIRNLHLTESTNPIIKSTLTEESEKIDINVGEMPMTDMELPLSMGDTQPEPTPQAKLTWHCLDLVTDPCHEVGSTSGLAFHPCVVINGALPTQSAIGKYVTRDPAGLYGGCDPNNLTAPPCDIFKVVDVCGPGGTNAPPPGNASSTCYQHPNGYYWTPQYQEIEMMIVDDCDYWNDLYGTETWNCDLGGPLSTGPGSCTPVQGPGGQYQTEQDCLDNCAREKRFECVPMETGPGPGTISEQSTTSMVCVQQAMGQYTSMADCQANCGDDKGHCINCKEGIMNTLAALGTKDCPDGWVLVQNIQQGPCYECDGNGNCNGPSWAMGPNVYNSQAECINGTPTQPACQQALQDYECVNGQCVVQSGGQFTGPTALADCQGVCGQPTLWECDTNNGCTQTANGTYQTQSQCETACCQDVISNWGWAQGSQSNPCQKFYNMFGPMGSTNPSTLPFNQQCIYYYLQQLVISTGGACVSGNFVGLLTQFANNQPNNGCYGNPASGCNNSTDPGCPSQNSICGKQDQFCNANPMTASKFFKCQYAISFASQNGCSC